jgi:MoaA/NifB/PqqE/SkfB family radical SAM enzyme
MPDKRLLISIHHGCQYRCGFCVYLHARPVKTMTLGEWIVVLEKAYASGFRTLEIGGRGEPALSPDIVPIVSRAHRLGYRIELLTNAQRPDVLRAILPSISLLTINLNATTAAGFREVHQPVGRGGFKKCTDNVRAVVASAVKARHHVDLKVNYVISKRTLSGYLDFPERLHQLFAAQLGPGRYIHVAYQHMHEYVTYGKRLGLDKGDLKKILAMFLLRKKDRGLARRTNLIEFIRKTEELRSRAGRALSPKCVCDVYKEVLFVENNGDVFGCYNPFRSVHGLPLERDPFYWGNCSGGDPAGVLARPRDVAAMIDVSRKYWRACSLCKARPGKGNKEPM